MGKRLTILALVVLVVALAGVYLIKLTPTSIQGELEARAVVEKFGRRMQAVSLLAPREEIALAIEREYGELVAAPLIAEWQNNTNDAPGRLTSSPWPDHIDISKVQKENVSRYVFEGFSIEVTNESGGVGVSPREAVRRPVTVAVESQGTEWKITMVKLGAYPGDGDWVLSEPNAQGLQFMYPKNLVTTFISVQEWPASTSDDSSTRGWPPNVVLEAGDYSCAEEQERAIGDREYCVVESQEGAAGSTYRTYEYITPQGDFIARVKFTLRFPQCANFNEPQKSACESEQRSFDVDGLADRVAQSIRML